MEDSIADKIRELGYVDVLSPLQRAAIVGASRKSASASKPQAQSGDIKILSTYVAGTSHVSNLAQLLDGIDVGSHLVLKRDVSNEFDSRATLVLDEQGRKLGFLPKATNEAAAALIDGGKRLCAFVTSVEDKGHSAAISIDVYLQDR